MYDVLVGRILHVLLLLLLLLHIQLWLFLFCLQGAVVLQPRNRFDEGVDLPEAVRNLQCSGERDRDITVCY